MQTNQNKFVKPADDNQLGQIVAGYLAYWPAFLVCLSLALGAAFFYLRYSTPKYEATATLVIKDQKKGDDYSKEMESIDMINTNKIIENETEVLQSRSIMDNVVRKLRLYAPVSQEGKIKTEPAYTTSPVLVESPNPDSLNQAKKIYFTYDKNKATVILNKNFSCAINTWVKTPYGTLRFVPNPNYDISTAGAKPLYFSLIQTKNVTEGKLAALKVEPVSKMASVLNLSFRDDVPEKAEDVLNELIHFYNAAAVSEKNTLVKNTLASIEKRLAVVSGDLDSIERKVQKYKAGNNAVELGTQGNLYLESVSSANNKLGEVNVQLSVLDELERYVSASDNNAGIAPSSMGLNDPNLSQLVSSYNNAQMEYERMRKTVAENNPMLLTLKEQLNKIKPNIVTNIQNQRKNLQLSRGNLASTSGKYNSLLNYIPQKEKQLLEISRDQQIKSAIYQFLLQKREESQLSFASTLSDSRVVNYAQSSRDPVSPKKMLIYVAAAILGLLVPVLLISAKELFNSKILYRKEIESLTQIPVIGEIAYNKSDKVLVVESGKRSFIAEEFRKIRVSLLFLGIDSYHKKILVTSSLPEEGKSFVAANLATSLAMTGKKVVLVDMDLHNPSLSNIFGMDDKPGVSDYLISDKKADQIINDTQINENLSFITSGNLQQDASELLENGKVQELISYLEGIYDLVIIDTAPVVLITDAYMLSSLCDATLYVVRHKYTPKMVVKRIDENNKVNPLKNPAIIFNGVKTRGFFKNNYGYGYDYVYGKKIKTKKEKKALV